MCCGIYLDDEENSAEGAQEFCSARVVTKKCIIWRFGLFHEEGQAKEYVRLFFCGGCGGHMPGRTVGDDVFYFYFYFYHFVLAVFSFRPRVCLFASFFFIVSDDVQKHGGGGASLLCDCLTLMLAPCFFFPR